MSKSKSKAFLALMKLNTMLLNKKRKKYVKQSEFEEVIKLLEQYLAIRKLYNDDEKEIMEGLDELDISELKPSAGVPKPNYKGDNHE